MNDLIFGRGNAKLPMSTLTFSLPAGWTCPGAVNCLSRADRATGRITDGAVTQFRCFAATDEARPSVRASRWANFDRIREALQNGAEECAALIARSIRSKLQARTTAVRMHVSGDFFSAPYLQAWTMAARQLPTLRFYAYSKSRVVIDAIVAGEIPRNMTFVHSMGGRFDIEARLRGLRLAWVVHSVAEAGAIGLAIDHDESIAMDASVREFALLLHGNQPAGSAAGKDWAELRGTADGGYGPVAAGRRKALEVVA